MNRCEGGKVKWGSGGGGGGGEQVSRCPNVHHEAEDVQWGGSGAPPRAPRISEMVHGRKEGNNYEENERLQEMK